MATCEAIYYKGHKIGAISNIAVQGVGVKGGVLTDDGTGVWRSADGLVSFTPTTAFASAISSVTWRMSGNIVTFQLALVAGTYSTGTIGTFSGDGYVQPPQDTHIAAMTVSNNNTTGSAGAADIYGANVRFYAIAGGVYSTSVNIAGSYSVPASGSVNPADAKTMLVDNDNEALGAIYPRIATQSFTMPTTNAEFIAILDTMPVNMVWNFQCSGSILGLPDSAGYYHCVVRNGGSAATRMSMQAWSYYAGVPLRSLASGLLLARTRLGNLYSISLSAM